MLTLPSLPGYMHMCRITRLLLKINSDVVALGPAYEVPALAKGPEAYASFPMCEIWPQPSNTTLRPTICLHRILALAPNLTVSSAGLTSEQVSPGFLLDDLSASVRGLRTIAPTRAHSNSPRDPTITYAASLKLAGQSCSPARLLPTRLACLSFGATASSMPLLVAHAPPGILAPRLLLDAEPLIPQ